MIFKMSLKDKKLFLLDMDGTIYEGARLFECVNEFLAHIESVGGQYVFITNNSSRSVKDYVIKLSKMGIKVTEDNFFTSSQATAFLHLLLQEQYEPGLQLYRHHALHDRIPKGVPADSGCGNGR